MNLVEKSVPVKQKDENLLQELEIPVELRKVLVDDWYLIQKQDKLHNLPAKHTVRDIFDDYVKYKVSKSECDKSAESALREIGRGICSLFDTLLGKQLLYKFERPQYAELLQKHPYKGMSHIYGAPHLLRLFCWKQGLVPKSQFDEVNCEYLMKHLNSIIKIQVPITAKDKARTNWTEEVQGHGHAPGKDRPAEEAEKTSRSQQEDCEACATTRTGLKPQGL
ncbi:mortality factor 4-like protein 1 [Neocloeon triangulifer]|uniref:mortality factor 4-like protein 1 n=1 Tax=Neocloeon triangulifer TaxID=2078957 RepID=UPI00286EF605|nr:mortality factor 4-like protein 1 [Neocloeon triangulifer]